MGQFRTGLAWVTEGTRAGYYSRETPRFKRTRDTWSPDLPPVSFSASQPHSNAKRRNHEYHDEPAEDQVFAPELQLPGRSRPAVLQFAMRRFGQKRHTIDPHQPGRLRLSSSGLRSRRLGRNSQPPSASHPECIAPRPHPRGENFLSCVSTGTMPGLCCMQYVCGSETMYRHSRFSPGV